MPDIIPENRQAVSLSPKDTAKAIWEMDADAQAEMFDHLYDMAGPHLLCVQFIAAREACQERNDNSLEAFQLMFASAFKHASDHY